VYTATSTLAPSSEEVVTAAAEPTSTYEIPCGGEELAATGDPILIVPTTTSSITTYVISLTTIETTMPKHTTTTIISAGTTGVTTSSISPTYSMVTGAAVTKQIQGGVLGAIFGLAALAL
jgi:hypothetical protein